MALEIYQHRSVMMAAPPRPVIDSKHSYIAMSLRIGMLF